MKIIHLEITTWVGTCAIGATHTYGKLVWSKNGDRFEKEEFELTRKMTRREVAEGNKESRETMGFNMYQRGATTRGFKDEGEVIAAGLKTAAALNPDGEYVLVEGEHYSVSARPILYAPSRFEAQVKRMNELSAEFEKQDGYGRWGRPRDEAIEKRAEEIDAEWRKLAAQIDPAL